MTPDRMLDIFLRLVLADTDEQKEAIVRDNVTLIVLWIINDLARLQGEISRHDHPTPE